MDHLTQLAAIVKKVRDELRVLADRLYILSIRIQEQTKAINKTSYTQGKSKETSPVLRPQFQIPDTIKTHKTADDTKKRGWEFFKIFVETVTMLAVIAYTVVACYQRRATLESNQINREALVSVQKAFISEHMDWLRMYDPPTNSHEWKFKETFTNYGNTGAKQATHYFELKTLPTEPTEEQFRGNISKFQFRPIAPKQGADSDPKRVPETELFGIDLGEPITAKITAQTSLSHNLFIWGWVVYRDIFPNTKRHVTEFCSHSQHADLIPSGNPSQPPTVSLLFSNCYTHNCQDEECADYKSITGIPEPH